MLLNHIMYGTHTKCHIMEGKTGMNSQQGKNYITEYFMLLKIFHQPFAYDLCGVVFCLRKVSREVFHLNAQVQKQPLL